MSASAATRSGGTWRPPTSSGQSKSFDTSFAAMSLRGDGGDLVALRELGQHGPERLARPQSAVQEDQRRPVTVGLVVEVDVVDLGVLAGALRVGGPIGGHGQAPSVRGKWNVEDSDFAWTWNSSVARNSVSRPIMGRFTPGFEQCRDARRQRINQLMSSQGP